MRRREPLQAITLMLMLLPPIGLYYSLLAGVLWTSILLASLLTMGMILAVFIP